MKVVWRCARIMSGALSVMISGDKRRLMWYVGKLVIQGSVQHLVQLHSLDKGVAESSSIM
jgi:hypothetical protein